MKAIGKSRFNRGTTMLELLISMAIVSIIFLLLSTALEASLSQFRKTADRSENVVANQTSLDWIRKDLESVMVERSGNVAPLPASTTEEQKAFFGGKLFYPVEINRTSGQEMPEPRSFQNGDPRFDSAAFIARIPIDSQFNIVYDLGRRGIANTTVVDSAVSWESMARVSLIGYYVSYTRDSPLLGAGRGAMRLHRHYRPIEGIQKQAYGGGLVFYVSDKINDTYDETGGGKSRPAGAMNPAAVRRGVFDNSELPFLCARFRYSSEEPKGVFAVQPWPANPFPELLSSPPPNYFPKPGLPEEWLDLSNGIHETVFPDEPIAHNVVRFEIKPYRRVLRKNGTYETMDAAALNQYLSLTPGDEWPCLVTPSFLDVTIGVINEQVARLLLTPDQWIVDWKNTDPTTWSDERRAIERGLTTHRLRVRVNTADQ
ncbi:type II secretion system protein [Verrucomicrobiales bacterium BCK34]|nr:type II secretion system protein [Verrucomicrobiales bacterium BCK34]